MFVVIVRYTRSTAEVEAVRPAHREFLAECYRNNQLIVSGPQNPRTGGILLSQLTDRDVLMALLKTDPFCTEQVAEYELIEFVPFQYHPDFSSFM